uniref:Uncharacterized protein n=1 Tax=Arundo donax TaxID=35708 RepID=A0A0A9CEX1_ARUDO
MYQVCRGDSRAHLPCAYAYAGTQNSPFTDFNTSKTKVTALVLAILILSGVNNSSYLNISAGLLLFRF